MFLLKQFFVAVESETEDGPEPWLLGHSVCALAYRVNQLQLHYWMSVNVSFSECYANAVIACISSPAFRTPSLIGR